MSGQGITNWFTIQMESINRERGILRYLGIYRQEKKMSSAPVALRPGERPGTIVGV